MARCLPTKGKEAAVAPCWRRFRSAALGYARMQAVENLQDFADIPGGNAEAVVAHVKSSFRARLVVALHTLITLSPHIKDACRKRCRESQ